MFGLNINLTKSKMVRLGNGSNTRRLTRTLDCKVVDLQSKYLGMSLGKGFQSANKTLWERDVEKDSYRKEKIHECLK